MNQLFFFLVIFFNTIVVFPQDGGTLKILLPMRQDGFNPICLDINNSSNGRIAALLYEHIFEFSDYKDFKLSDAKGVTASKSFNGNRLILRLKDSLKWRQNNVISPTDVIMTIKAIRASDNNYLKRLIKDILYESIEGNRVILTLRNNYNINKLHRSLNSIFVCASSQLTIGQCQRDSPLNTTPLSSGPYRFDPNNSGTSYTGFKANQFFRGRVGNGGRKPFFNTIIVSYNNDIRSRVNEIPNNDVVTDLTKDLIDYYLKAGSNTIGVLPYKDLSFYCLIVNHHKITNPLSCRGVDSLLSQNLRQAITRGINRENILKSIYANSGMVLPGPFNSIVPYHDNSLQALPFNKDTAIGLIERSGYRMNRYRLMEKNNGILSLKLIYPKDRFDSYQTIAMLDMIVGQLHLIGIQLEYVGLDKNDYDMQLRNGGDYDLALTEITLDETFDVGYLFHSRYNSFGYRNKSVDDLLEDLDESSDEQKGRTLERTLRDECPFIFLFHVDKYLSYKLNIIGTPKLSTGTLFGSIEDWSRE